MIEQVVLWGVGAVLAVSAVLALLRMVRGPSIVDRAVANEVLVGIMICALGVEAAVTRHDTTLPILVSLSLVGFLASVAVARFVGGDAAPPPARPEDGGDAELLDEDVAVNSAPKAGAGLETRGDAATASAEGATERESR